MMKNRAHRLPCGMVSPLVFFVFLCIPVCTELSAGTHELSLDSPPPQLAAQLENAYQKSLDNGLPNFVPYSLALIIAAQDACTRHDYARAAVLSEYAQKLSPDLAPVYLLQARIAWCTNKLRVFEAIRGYLSAGISRLQSLEDLSFLLSLNLVAAAGAFLLTLCIFSMTSFIKYGALLFHDVRHLVADPVPDTALRGMLLVMLVLPLILGLSLFWLSLFWLLLFFNYYTGRERFAAIGLFAGAACMPVIIFAFSLSLFVFQSDIIKHIWNINYEYWSPHDIERLETASRSHPDDQEILFSLGLAHKKEQNYRTALRYYSKLLEVNPDHFRGWSNIGNVYFAIGQWQQAVEAYNRAQGLAPAMSEAAHFNLARSYQQKFLFKEAEQELAEAKKINAPRIDRQLALYSEHYNRLLIDETVPRYTFWERGYRGILGSRSGLYAHWDLFCGGVPLRFAAPLIIGLLVCALLAVKKDVLRIASACQLCGRALCRRCQMTIAEDGLCAQCRTFSHKQQKIDVRARQQKISNISRFVKRSTVIGLCLSVLFPGAGHVWKGQPLKGASILFIYTVLLLKVAAVLMVTDHWHFLGFSGIPRTLLLVLVLAGLWIFSVRDAWRLRGAEAEARLFVR